VRRLFVAIDVPESLQQILTNVNPNWPGVRWTEPQLMHLTLVFFGSVPEQVEHQFRQNLTAIEFGAFFLPIVGLGAFPPKGPPKILWIGVGRGHPHLFQIHKRVQEAALSAALEPELRPWHPHITLARCSEVNASVVRKFLKENADFEAGTIRVTEFHLYSSKLTPAGPIHTRELTIQSRD
jgi:2'-5' RNA ligase